MKLAYTTLACPSWDLATIIDQAVACGYHGVDFRGYQDTLAIYEKREFSRDLAETARRFTDAGLEIPCLSTSIRLVCDYAGSQANRDELRAYLPLCAAFGTRQLRVFGGGWGAHSRDSALQVAGENLWRLAEIASDAGVDLLVETHDEWVDAQAVRALMLRTARPNAAVLWDINHPYRAGEDIAITVSLLGKWIRNTHWKDSRTDPGDRRGFVDCLPGQGALPLTTALKALQGIRYDGYATLEWEKRWHPDLPAPEIALPAFVAHMQRIHAI